MASTKRSDVINLDIFAEMPQLQSLEKNIFFNSGIAQNSNYLDASVLSDTGLVYLDCFAPMASAEPNYNDDSDTKAGVKSVGKIRQSAISFALSEHFGYKNIIKNMKGSEQIEDVIRAGFDKIWETDRNRRIMSAAKAMLDDSVANHGGDMVYASAIGDVATTDELVQAAITIGEDISSYQVAVMHPAVYAMMHKDIKMSANIIPGLEIPTIMGIPVRVCDNATAGLLIDPNGGNPIYTTLLLGEGVFSYGVGSPDKPFAITEDELTGNGGGETIFTERSHFILHPDGYSWAGDDIFTTAPSYTQLQNAANWTRKVDRNRIKVAALRTQLTSV